MNDPQNTYVWSKYIIMTGFVAFIVGGIVTTTSSKYRTVGYFISMFGFMTFLVGIIFYLIDKSRAMTSEGFDDESDLTMFLPDPNMYTRSFLNVISEPTMAPMPTTTTGAPTTTQAPIPITTTAAPTPTGAPIIGLPVVIIYGNNFLGLCDNCTDLCTNLLCPKGDITADCLFTIEPIGSATSSTVAIRNNKTGMYLTLCQKCYSTCPNTVCANGTSSAYDQSQFTLIRSADNFVSFLAPNGKYLEYIDQTNIADNPANQACFGTCSTGFLSCNSDIISPTTKFFIIDP